MPKLITMERETFIALLFGIASLLLGAAASLIGFIVHFQTAILMSVVGTFLVAAGGAAAGYVYGVYRTILNRSFKEIESRPALYVR